MWKISHSSPVSVPILAMAACSDSSGGDRSTEAHVITAIMAKPPEGRRHCLKTT